MLRAFWFASKYVPSGYLKYTTHTANFCFLLLLGRSYPAAKLLVQNVRARRFCALSARARALSAFLSATRAGSCVHYAATRLKIA